MALPPIDRRAALRLVGTIAASALTMSDTTYAAPALTVVDHLLLGAADLDRGIAWVEERTGVKPAIGGSHPGRGTRNALLSLGNGKYLEVIAPDPAQTTYTFQIDVRTLSEPRLITWAVGTTDIEAVARRAKAAGYQVVGPADGSRARPDGTRLAWRTLGIASTVGASVVNPIPFFIQWSANTLHPSIDAPKGCALKELRMTHPNASAVTTVLGAVAIEAEVANGPDAAIHAALTTPKGLVHLR
jgi:Glyoxalase-like domain